MKPEAEFEKLHDGWNNPNTTNDKYIIHQLCNSDCPHCNPPQQTKKKDQTSQKPNPLGN